MPAVQSGDERKQFLDEQALAFNRERVRRVAAVVTLERIVDYEVCARLRGVEMRTSERVCGFHDHHIPSVTGDHVVKVCLQRREIPVPVGIVRSADDVEIHTARYQFVEPFAPDGVVPAALQMQHHLCIAGVLHRAAARGNEAGEVVISGSFLTGNRVAEPSCRPEHAVGNLVANLHHVRVQPYRTEGEQHVPRVVVYALSERLQVQFRPGFRRELAAGIAPEIAVVQIEQKTHARVLCPPRQALYQRKVAGAAAVRRAGGRIRIDPEPEPRGVDAVFREDLNEISRFAVLPEHAAEGFRFFEGGKIHAEIKHVQSSQESMRRSISR